MSSEKDRYWQPPGLSAIQFQLNITLTRRANGDEFGCFDALRDLAVLTESAEIIELAEKFAKQTSNALAARRTTKPYTDADRYKLQQDDAQFMIECNYHFRSIARFSLRRLSLKMK